MTITLEDIFNIPTAVIYNPDSYKSATSVSIDTRSLKKKSLYVAIKGKSFDGHNYIEKLYVDGIRIFVVSKYSEPYKEYHDAHFFVVDNTLTALQKLTASHRNSFDIPVIGITGSNGKTIVKEWLFQLLSKDKKMAGKRIFSHARRSTRNCRQRPHPL